MILGLFGGALVVLSAIVVSFFKVLDWLLRGLLRFLRRY